MQRRARKLFVALACSSASFACHKGHVARVELPSVPPGDLRELEGFSAISGEAERSRAIFLETMKVYSHPRCANCHPSGDTPFQGDAGRVHDPPVARGPQNEGIPALMCKSCHQDRNQELARVPGAPHWSLAPREMAWVAKSTQEVCQQLKDRTRNGDRTMDEIIEHVAHDPLVAWGWDPGHGRTPAPGSQARFAALVRAWVDTGAECPPEETEGGTL